MALTPNISLPCRTKNIEGVPLDELIDEIQFQWICHNKPRYPNNVVTRELITLLQTRPDIITVSELFRYLKFKAYHDPPLTSPTHDQHQPDVGVNCVVDTADTAVNCVVDTTDAAVTCSILPNALVNPTEPVVTKGGFAPIPFAASATNPHSKQSQEHSNRTSHGFIPSATRAIPSSFSSEFSRIYRELTDMGLSHFDATNCAAARVTQPSSATIRAIPPLPLPITSTLSQPACYPPVPPSNILDQSIQEQKQAITLIAAVSPFSGSGSIRFETWIKHVESQLDTAEFEERKKIKLVCSRKSNDAFECVLTFKEKNPISANVYKNVKSCLIDRFHPHQIFHGVPELHSSSGRDGEKLRMPTSNALVARISNSPRWQIG